MTLILSALAALLKNTIISCYNVPNAQDGFTAHALNSRASKFNLVTCTTLKDFITNNKNFTKNSLEKRKNMV